MSQKRNRPGKNLAIPYPSFVLGLHLYPASSILLLSAASSQSICLLLSLSLSHHISLITHPKNACYKKQEAKAFHMWPIFFTHYGRQGKSSLHKTKNAGLYFPLTGVGMERDQVRARPRPGSSFVQPKI